MLKLSSSTLGIQDLTILFYKPVPSIVDRKTTTSVARIAVVFKEEQTTNDESLSATVPTVKSSNCAAVSK